MQVDNAFDSKSGLSTGSILLRAGILAAPFLTPVCCAHPTVRLVFLLILFFLAKAEIPALAFSTNDAGAIFSAYRSAFYVVSGTNGYFKNDQSGGVEYFWSQAEEIECVIDTYEWTSNATYKGMITNLLNGFISNNGTNWSYNIYNDDCMWACIAFARGCLDTGNTGFRTIAKANFDMVYARGWDATFGGGLWWNTDNLYKN